MYSDVKNWLTRAVLPQPACPRTQTRNFVEADSRSSSDVEAVFCPTERLLVNAATSEEYSSSKKESAADDHCEADRLLFPEAGKLKA